MIHNLVIQTFWFSVCINFILPKLIHSLHFVSKQISSRSSGAGPGMPCGNLPGSFEMPGDLRSFAPKKWRRLLTWGYPQSSSISMAFSISNHPAIGVSPFLETPIYLIYLDAKMGIFPDKNHMWMGIFPDKNHKQRLGYPATPMTSWKHPIIGVSECFNIQHDQHLWVFEGLEF